MLGVTAPLMTNVRKCLDELYAAGDYPNRSPGGEGLPRFVDWEPIDDKDLVVWYTMGFHHMTRPEDWPVLPTVRRSVTLHPHRFFTRNPALNVPRESGSAERKGRRLTRPWNREGEA